MRQMKLIIKTTSVILCFCLCSRNASAQEVSQTQRHFKRNAATVIFASLGGGILGLSTLSFYGKPQEHTDNITIGVASGLIAGLFYIFSQGETEARRDVLSPWIPDTTQKASRLVTQGTPAQILWQIDF